MKNSPTFVKRQREKARRERQEQKAARRLEANARKAANPRQAEDGEDPDIAGIVPGPQPPQED